MESFPYRVLLYYSFVPVADPEAERTAQQALASELGLRGRILIAHEGLNGTVSGPPAATEAWQRYHRAHPLFAEIEFKQEPAEGHLFPRLSIRTREEVIAMDYVLPADAPTAPYIEPEQMRELLRHPDPDTVILDTRSNYETAVGKFRGALTMDVASFREFAQQLDSLAHLRQKRIVTYCTGGIRCEKLTALMLEKGFTNVLQLHGGIIRYGQAVGGEGFEGQCYVFDDRVVTAVNTVDPVVIGRCSRCQAPTEKIINCANLTCNLQLLLCSDCAASLAGCCSESCQEAERVRVYNGLGHYRRGSETRPMGA